jgi:hypothetical protein
MRNAIIYGAVVVALGVCAIALPTLRRELIRDVVTWDAPPRDTPPLPPGNGPGLPPTPRTRVVLVDGLSAEVSPSLAAWSGLCKRGLQLRVDVGFPTISLPVELALWSGLTQQQTGVMFRADRPLDPPFDQRGIPAQVPGSIAIAESHGWIVRSLGFARVEPAADGKNPAKDADPDAWKQRWFEVARTAVASDARLVFVHVLRVDEAGHHHGIGDDYRRVAGEADELIAKLVASDREARWFLVTDHGHLPVGGHGGEESEVRQVEACIAGPGITIHQPAPNELVHIVDIARAIADSTGATLDRASRGRPITAAITAPLARDEALPAIGLGAGAIALFVLAGGLAASSWGVRRWWLAPWWWVAAGALLYFVRGEPTLSMRMVYAPEGRDMYLAWLPALPLAAAATYIGLGRRPIAQVIVSQLALPVAAAASVITVTGAWPALFGAEVAPVVPRFTAYMSPLVLMVAHGAAAVALAVLARLVRPMFGRRAPAEPPKSEPAAGA